MDAPTEAQLDKLEAIGLQFMAGDLTIDEAAEQIVGIGFTDSFAIGADSADMLQSAEFKPYRDLLDAVLRLQGRRRGS
jgi:hypothetical protein